MRAINHLLVVAVTLLACATSLVAGQDPTPLSDGVFIDVPANTAVTYFTVELHSFGAHLSEMIDSGVSVPPLLVAWTAGSQTWPTIYASWEGTAPSNTSYDFTSNNGMLSIPGSVFVGQSHLYISVDQSSFSTATAFSIGFTVFGPIQLRSCPYRQQNVYVDGQAMVQFQTQLTERKDVVFETSIITDGESVTKPLNSPILVYVGTQPNPDGTNYQWTSFNGSIDIPATDPNYPNDLTFYVGVYGEVDARFTIEVDTNCAQKKIALE
jgi:hypothetical protein